MHDEFQSHGAVDSFEMVVDLGEETEIGEFVGGVLQVGAGDELAGGEAAGERDFIGRVAL